MEAHKRGISVTEKQLSKYILLQADSKARTHNFKNKQISENWWTDFYDRHPEISKKKGRGIERERLDNITPEVIDPFYQVLNELEVVSLFMAIYFIIEIIFRNIPICGMNHVDFSMLTNPV